MENQTLVIVDVPQRTQIIVKRKATLSDLTLSNRFLIPIDGGHATATYAAMHNGGFYFTYNNENIRLESLDNIFVI